MVFVIFHKNLNIFFFEKGLESIRKKLFIKIVYYRMRVKRRIINTNLTNNKEDDNTEHILSLFITPVI